METLMWAVDLVLVAALCLWAGRQDRGDSGNDKRKEK